MTVKHPHPLPKFPICSQGGEGCHVVGFHGNCGPSSEAERARVRAWFDAVALVAARNGGSSSRDGEAERVEYQRLMNERVGR